MVAYPALHKIPEWYVDVQVPPAANTNTHAEMVRLLEDAPATDFWTDPRSALTHLYQIQQAAMAEALRPPRPRILEDRAIPPRVSSISHRVVQGVAVITQDLAEPAGCFASILGFIGMFSPGTVGTASALINGANALAALVDSRDREAREDEQYLWEMAMDDADAAYAEGDMALVIAAHRRLADVPSSSTDVP